MDAQSFVKFAKQAFRPLLAELEFEMGMPATQSLCYSIDFMHPRCIVVLSHEPPDPAIHCRVFTRAEGRLSDPEDHEATLTTAELVARGIKTDRRAVWTFLHSEGLSFKKNGASGRAGPA